MCAWWLKIRGHLFMCVTAQNGPHHLFGIVPLQHPQSLLAKLLERKRWRQLERQIKPEQTRCVWPVQHPPSTSHPLLFRDAEGVNVSVSHCVEEAKWWMLAHVMTSRRRWVFSGQGEAAITHYTPPQLSPTHSSVPFTKLYFMYLHRWRCKGTAHSAPPPWWAGEASLRGSDWWLWTTASGIMLAGAIYKQKHGLCLCRLWRILPFLSQTLLERALHSGSNVIFYWESTIPRIEMAKESYKWRVIMLVSISWN